MNGRLALRLKKEVTVASYLGDGVTMDDLKKERKSVYANGEFKSMYRARKKFHHLHKNEQQPKHMNEDTGFDEVAAKMCQQRKSRKKQSK